MQGASLNGKTASWPVKQAAGASANTGRGEDNSGVKVDNLPIAGDPETQKVVNPEHQS